ncbi:MAG: PIN domain-containing protein [Candidatus Aenigmatarchaeota archaeon]
MELVVDANVLFSFFKSESTVRDIIIDPESKFGLMLYAPELMLSELDKHKSEICVKARISEEGYELSRNVLETFVKSMPNEFWQDCKEDASKLLPEHPKDTPYFALALKLGCAIWSNEKKLKWQSVVKIFSTKELLELFK